MIYYVYCIFIIYLYIYIGLGLSYNDNCNVDGFHFSVLHLILETLDISQRLG